MNSRSMFKRAVEFQFDALIFMDLAVGYEYGSQKKNWE